MAQKSKILTIGGATQDIYLQYQGADCMKIMERSGERNYMLFESGAKVEVEKTLFFTGGGATNSAVSFTRLGFDVACCCKIGDDQAGEAILKDLSAEGVDVGHIITTKEHPSGTSFVVNSVRGERTIFAYRGSNGFLSHDDIPFDAIEAADQLYITSLSHKSASILGMVVAHAKQHNIPVAMNPGVSQLSTADGAQELKKSLQQIDILILNSSEAKTFMGALVASDQRYEKVFASEDGPEVRPETGEAQEAYLLKTPLLHENLYFSITNFFKEVMTMGPHTVVVTDGARGVYVACKNTVCFHPSLCVDVVDTLGAGDSFGSCFVGCLLRGLDVENALLYGIANSASVIGKFGAKPGLLSLEDLEKRVESIKPTLLQRYEL